MPKKIDLTAVVTTHNEGLLAHKTMQSVFEAVQMAEATGFTCEILVHIDNGDKATKEYFARYKNDKKVRIFENKFGDVSQSRNFAVSQARGEYVAFLDGDDLISPNWYREALKILRQNDKKVIVYPEAILTFGMDVKNNVLTLQKDSMAKKDEIMLMIGENPRGSVLMAKKTLLEKYPYRPLNGCYNFEDYDLNVRTVDDEVKHKIAKETVLFYRRSATSRLSSANGDSALLPYMDAFDFAKVKSYRDSDKEKPSLSRRAYRLYKKMRDNEKINFFITPVARVAKSIIKPDPKAGEVPDFVVNEWLAMNRIDPQLYPYKYLVKSVQIYDAVRYADVGKVYVKLARCVSAKPDYVFVVPWVRRGGADKVLMNYIRALKEVHPKWHFAVIATLDDKNKWADRLPEDVDFLPFGTLSAGLFPALQDVLFSRLLIQLDCRRVHIINSEYGYDWARKHKKLFEKELKLNVSLFSDEPIPGSEAKAVFTYDVPYLFEIYDVVNKILTDNETIIGKAVARSGYGREKFRVHYQPVEDLKVEKPKEALVEDGKLRILWAGRIVPTKLPDVVAKIGQRLDPTKYTIDVYGEASDKQYKKDLIGVPSINCKGSFDGFNTLPTEKYDILLYTSASDGLPNVLLEAAAAGLPIIASNDGGVGEFIKDEKTGILVEDYLNPEAYVKAIENALKDPKMLPKYAVNAQKLLKERHVWAKFVDAVRRDIE